MFTLLVARLFGRPGRVGPRVFTQVRVVLYWAKVLPLPAAITWRSVSGIPADMFSAGVEKGPRPVPLVVAPVMVAAVVALAIWKANWSDVLIRLPMIVFWSRIVAKRTANITPCKPPACVSTVTLVGLLLPRI